MAPSPEQKAILNILSSVNIASRLNWDAFACIPKEQLKLPQISSLWGRQFWDTLRTRAPPDVQQRLVHTFSGKEIAKLTKRALFYSTDAPPFVPHFGELPSDIIDRVKHEYDKYNQQRLWPVAHLFTGILYALIMDPASPPETKDFVTQICTQAICGTSFFDLLLDFAGYDTHLLFVNDRVLVSGVFGLCQAVIIGSTSAPDVEHHLLLLLCNKISLHGQHINCYKCPLVPLAELLLTWIDVNFINLEKEAQLFNDISWTKHLCHLAFSHEPNVSQAYTEVTCRLFQVYAPECNVPLRSNMPNADSAATLAASPRDIALSSRATPRFCLPQLLQEILVYMPLCRAQLETSLQSTGKSKRMLAAVQMANLVRDVLASIASWQPFSRQLLISLIKTKIFEELWIFSLLHQTAGPLHSAFVQVVCCAFETQLPDMLQHLLNIGFASHVAAELISHRKQSKVGALPLTALHSVVTINDRPVEFCASPSYLAALSIVGRSIIMCAPIWDYLADNSEWKELECMGVFALPLQLDGALSPRDKYREKERRLVQEIDLMKDLLRLRKLEADLAHLRRNEDRGLSSQHVHLNVTDAKKHATTSVLAAASPLQDIKPSPMRQSSPIKQRQPSPAKQRQPSPVEQRQPSPVKQRQTGWTALQQPSPVKPTWSSSTPQQYPCFPALQGSSQSENGPLFPAAHQDFRPVQHPPSSQSFWAKIARYLP